MLVIKGLDRQKVGMSVSQGMDRQTFVRQSVSPQFRDRQNMDMSVS